MAIKDPLMFITIEEFKNWKGFNNQLFDEITTPDSEIRYAIEIVSNNIDYLSGFTISKKWPEITPTKFTDNIQTATTHYVNFLLSKGVEYARGQASIGQGGIVYSQNNPEDPYFIPPQVFNYLRDINEYENMQGFNLNLSNKQSFFSKFLSNRGEVNRLIEYLKILNLKSSDNRVKINIYQSENLDSPVVDIDTRGIKSIDNLTTLELFNKYFSNDSLQLVDGKKGQQQKVISISDEIGKLIESKQPLLTKDNFGDNMIVSGSGKDIKISATGGKTDLSDYYKKEEVDKKLEDKMDKEQFQYAFAINTISTKIPNLETTDKTIAGAINEINKKSSSIPQWKEVGTKVNINHIKYNFITNKKYKIYYNFENQTSIKKFSFICKEFLYGELNTDVQTLDWDKVNDRIMVSLQMQNDTVAIVSDPTRYGQLLKLEELQE